MENKEPVTQTEGKTEENTVTQTDKTEENAEVKTFTQDEVNSIVRKAENKLNKKYEGIDIKKYREWEDSQKTEAEKQNETLIENEKLKEEINQLKNQSTVINAEVDKKFVKFVTSEVSNMSGDFEENLEDYLKENPQFLVQKVVTQENVKDTGVATTKISENAESGVAAILKARHPNLFN